jgi:hypothetical protein
MSEDSVSDKYKTREDRVAEGVNILKQLLGTGVTKDDSSYLQVKIFIDKWIADGLTVEESVEFPRYGRRLVMTLPRRKERVAEAVFKIVRRR